MRRPDFGRHKDIAALDAGGMQALAYFTLIIVHLRGVDVAVAEPQRLFHHANASPPAQIPGAEPNERDLGALRSDARCWPNRAHASHCGACGGLTIREFGRWSFAISAISASLSLRSRLPRFSASRSRFEVRGIGMICCCSRKRNATWVGVFPWALPIAAAPPRQALYRAPADNS